MKDSQRNFMSCKPTIVFDLDGTLVDTIHDLVACLNRVSTTRGLKPVSVDQVGYVCGQGVRAMIKLAYALNNQSIDENILNELSEIFMQDYARDSTVNTVLYPGVESCLQQFDSNNWLLAVCTNKPVKLADKFLWKLGIRKLFSAVSGGDSFTFRKPDSRHLITTIEMAGGHPSRAIMIGDTYTDILAAQNSDIPVIAVDFGYSENPVASYRPNRVISSFSQLFTTATSLIKGRG